MPVKDLTAHLTPDLVLPYREHAFVVPPPTREDGLLLTAINAAGVAAYSAGLEKCPTCGREGAPELPQDTLDLLEASKQRSLGEVALGPAYAEMVAARVPEAHIDDLALYALYYWTLGEQTADAIFAARREGDASGEARSATSTSPRGPRTASESRTPKGSSRGTAASRRR